MAIQYIELLLPEYDDHRPEYWDLRDWTEFGKHIHDLTKIFWLSITLDKDSSIQNFVRTYGQAFVATGLSGFVWVGNIETKEMNLLYMMLNQR